MSLTQGNYIIILGVIASIFPRLTHLIAICLIGSGVA
jgi:hypothetical protein